MKGFIQLSTTYVNKMLININHICEVWEQPTKQTSFTIVGGNDSDFHTTNTPFEEVKKMISEAL